MIIAIANQNGGSGKTIVANNLALLRARTGRKVLLLDADPKQSSTNWGCERSAAGVRPRIAARALAGRALEQELDTLRRHYNDIVIDTEGRDTAESRAALNAARLVVVPVSAEQADLASQYKLIARLNAARMFNPHLRVLFVAVANEGDADEADADDLAAIRAYAARVMSATLAGTVIHEQLAAHRACGRGRCVCDGGSDGASIGDPGAAAEMQALYKEVFIP